MSAAEEERLDLAEAWHEIRRLRAEVSKLNAEAEQVHRLAQWREKSWQEEVARARAEVARLHGLFDAAGKGEHNVLALVDYYQALALSSDAEVARLREDGNGEAADLFAQACAVQARAVQRWGIDRQLDMVIEEAGELIVSVQHAKRGRDHDLPGEAADVLLVLGAVAAQHGEALRAAFRRKLARLLVRLEVDQ